MYYRIDDHIIDRYVEAGYRAAMKEYYKLPPIDWPEFHKKIEALGLQTYDTAVPQPWADDVCRLTGEYPVGHFVWSYDEDRCFGKPFPITREGQMIERVYNFLKGSK